MINFLPDECTVRQWPHYFVLVHKTQKYPGLCATSFTSHWLLVLFVFMLGRQHLPTLPVLMCQKPLPVINYRTLVRVGT